MAAVVVVEQQLQGRRQQQGSAAAEFVKFVAMAAAVAVAEVNWPLQCWGSHCYCCLENFGSNFVVVELLVVVAAAAVVVVESATVVVAAVVVLAGVFSAASAAELKLAAAVQGLQLKFKQNL